MKHNHFVSCAALVTNQAGEILLVKSPLRGWEYPGGLIEPGETFQQALKREVREEAGVEIEITGFVGICKRCWVCSWRWVFNGKRNSSVFWRKKSVVCFCLFFYFVFLPCFFRYKPSLPTKVVLPAPCKPAIIITVG